MNTSTLLPLTAAAPQLSTEPLLSVMIGGWLQAVAVCGDVTVRLPRPVIEAARATPRRLLAPPLKSLAQAVAPEQILVECGGDGQCGPNVIAYLLGLLGIFDGDGRQLRHDIVQYVRAGRVLEEPTQFHWNAPPHEALTVKDLLLENMRSWPATVLQGREIGVAQWCEITDNVHAWTDLTWLQLCATRFSVEIQLVGVNDVGVVEPIMTVQPAGHRRPVGTICVGCWIGQHFVALVDVLRNAAEGASRRTTHDTQAAPPGAGAQNDASHATEHTHPSARSNVEGSDVNNTEQPITEDKQWRLDCNCIDLRTAVASCVVLIHISVLIQPLILAHLDGFTVLGAQLPEQQPKSSAVRWTQQLCDDLWSARVISFLVGVTQKGMRLFTTPVEFAPSKDMICRTPEQRASMKRKGTTWAWCTRSALRGTAIAPLAAQAILATLLFVRPPESLQQAAELGLTAEPLEFQLGRTISRSVVRRPLIDQARGPPAERALSKLLQQDEWLQQLLRKQEETDSRLEGWRERITPPPMDEIPPQLLANLPSLSDVDLLRVPLPLINIPYQLPWVATQPPQAPPKETPPMCPTPRDMLTEEARGRLQTWLDAQLRDLVAINSSLAQGISADEIDRSHRPKAIAIGQQEMKSWARGVVWDCRQPCCEILDYRRPFSTDLNLDLIREELGCYPDQQMLSFVLEGVRLQADVELQTVLVPHLMSLPQGFRSVDKEIRRLQQMNWYDFFPQPPFFPIYLNGQGAVARKLEPDRFRRSTEGGGPRKDTYDAEGVRTLSLNEAAKLHHQPRYWNGDKRETFQQWVRTKEVQEGPQRHAAPWVAPYCDVRSPTGQHVQPQWQTHTKWPKERKPTLATVMVALAVLGAAADFLHQPIYVFSDDAKDYFNQLGMATEELWKLGIVFLERVDDAPDDAKLLFVSEKRLGFGTHGASNTAQRFSDALIQLFERRMDESDADAGVEDVNPDLWLSWMQRRKEVSAADSTQCRKTRQHAGSDSLRAKGVDVCPQQRLWFVTMYTDDPIFVIVGARRATRALRCWRQLTQDLNLIMAIPEKRVLGSWASWIGALLFAPLGLVVIPRHKLLRAASMVQHVLDHGCPFHVYRSLCGLLEHFRAINLRGRNVMHGLYEPHQSDGPSRFGPEATVRCSPLMRKQLQRWLHLIFQSGGVDVRAAVDAETYHTPADVPVVMDSDACHGDADPSGIGGFMHGQYWYFPIPPDCYHEVDTPMLEFLGVCFNILIFGPQLAQHQGEVVLRTDALTAALTLPEQSMRSAALVAAYQWLIQTEQWRTLAPRLRIQHIFGDANVMADAISRAHWAQFLELCARLSIRPRRIDINTRADLAELFAVTKVKGVRARTRQGAHPAPRLPLAGALPQLDSAYSAKCLEKLAVRKAQPLRAPKTADFSAPGTAQMRRSSTAALRKLVRDQQPAQHDVCVRTDVDSAPLPLPITQCCEGVALPPQLPRAKDNPVLTRINQRAALLQAATFQQGDADMRFNMAPQQLAALAAAVHEGVDYGINTNTGLKDSRAWVMWEHICAQHGTDPFRSASEVRDYPQRNAHLLAALLLHAFSVGVPKDKSRQFIRPRSAFAYPLAIIRVFARWGIQMPSYKQIKSSLAHLSRLYIAFHGPYSLAPRRAEPMKYSMVLRMNAITAHQVGAFPWTDNCQPVFMFRRLNLVLWPTGFRLGEIVQHSSGEVMYLTFESLTWCVNNTHHADPTPGQLAALAPGKDYAMLAPPRSKPDQWGEIHCPYPVILTFYAEQGNAAAALRDLELNRIASFPTSQRRDLPLFHDAQGKPFTHAFLASMLRDVLTHCYGPKVASLYTWHSYRSGLATALHAAGVEDGMIMLICRWMSPESLHVYRRMGTAENERHTRRAMSVNVDLIQATNVPKVMGDQGYSELFQTYRNMPDPTNVRAPTEDTGASPPSPPLPTTPRTAVETPRRDAPCAPTAAAPAAAPGALKRKRPPRPAHTHPPSAGTTTGVGALTHQFPPSLNDYVTYNDRPSKRRLPTPRSRAQWQRVS